MLSSLFCTTPHGWKFDDERGAALALALALGPHHPALRLDEVPDNREADAEPP
jgi:hypothetical protein